MTRSLLCSALVALVVARGADSFVGSGGAGDFAAVLMRASPLGGPFAVGTEELDEDLSEEEKTIINVYRSVGPSVAFVTSTRRTGKRGGGKRSGLRRGKEDAESKENDAQNNTRQDIKPDGTSLGSGSGFVVCSDGYLVTNYHVIERAFTITTAINRYNSQIDQLVGNATASLGTSPFLSTLENRTKQALRVEERPNDAPRASVYVRINSSTKYQNCRIVDVRPDLDVAVLKVELSEEEPSLTAVQYGSSSKLLVGQRVIAIGNVSRCIISESDLLVAFLPSRYHHGTSLHPFVTSFDLTNLLSPINVAFRIRSKCFGWSRQCIESGNAKHWGRKDPKLHPDRCRH